MNNDFLWVSLECSQLGKGPSGFCLLAYCLEFGFNFYNNEDLKQSKTACLLEFFCDCIQILGLFFEKCHGYYDR